MTGALVRYEERESSLDLAPKAWNLANQIANTQFVPKDLRGKPEAVLACILAGHEAGITPMQALAKIHVIEGKPGMSAELMRALVMSHGHDIVFEELGSTRCRVSGKRRDSERWTTVEFTMDDARTAGVIGKDNWRKWPTDMLAARASGRLCRLIFSDVLAGLSYTLEELADMEGDQSLVDFGPVENANGSGAPPPPTTKARASRAATRGAKPEPSGEPPMATAPRGDLPPLPGGDPGDVIHDAEVVETTARETPPPPPATPPPPAADAPPADPFTLDPTMFPPAEEPPPGEVSGSRFSGPQLIAMKFTEKGIKDRDERLAIAGTLVGRPIASGNDLTPDEVRTVLDYLSSTEAEELVEVLVGLGKRAGAQGPTRTEEDPPPAAPPAQPAPAPATSSSTWTPDQWRTFLRDRKVKVTEVLKEAQQLASARHLPPPTTLDALAASPLASELVGFVEDLSLERK